MAYQVYPRSFADANGDGTGDLLGLCSRIPYLAGLGVDAVWLTPFYPSALADGGYDVDDHREVDPQLGTLDDFDRLVSRAHAAGLKVLVDVVPNHTSNRHAWFREALAAGPGSRARARYVFRDGGGSDGSRPPSGWRSAFGGSAWQRVPDGQWYLHLFGVEQPDLNWDDDEVRADFVATLRFWSDRGVDGFRVDVADGLVKDLSTPLRPQAERSRLPEDGSDPLLDRDGVHEIYRAWRQVLDEYVPPRSAVAEAWVPPARRMLYARSDELGQAFNFDLLKAPFEAGTFRSVIAANLTLAGSAGTSSTWVLSNHDMVRHATRYALPAGCDLAAWVASDGRSPEPDTPAGLGRARAATLLMLALPGSAYLYQGEELGLAEVADLPPEAVKDPVWRRSDHTRKGRDGCRVPLPWDQSDPSYGFSAEPSWLPQPPWFGDVAVSVQDRDPDSTLSLYRAALTLRRRLQQGEQLTWAAVDAGDVLAFDRHAGWRSTTNFGDSAVPLPPGRVLISSRPVRDGVLPPATTVWTALPTGGDTLAVEGWTS